MNDRKRRILVIGMAALVLFGTALSTYVADYRARRSAIDRAESVLLDSAREQAATFASAFVGRFQVLESLEAFLSMSGEEDPAAIEQKLDTATETAGLYFVSVDLLYPDGSMATSDGSFDLNVADREYFQQAMAGERAMQNITSRRSGRHCVAMAVPYYKDGVVSGVIRGIYSEEKLRALLSSEAYGGGGYSMLVCNHGDVIVNAEKEAGLLKEDNLFNALQGAVFHDGDSLETLREDFLEGKSAALRYTYADELRIAVLYPLGSDILPENDWFVFNVMPEDTLLSEVQASRKDSIESMTIFATFSLLALFFFLMLEWGNRRRLEREAEATRQREEQFRIVTQQSGKFVMRYDIPTRTAYMGESEADGFNGAQTYADAPEAIIAQGIVDPVSQADYRAFFQKIDAGKSPVETDILMLRPGGERRWYKHASTTICDKNGEPQTAVISYFDNTDQRERALAYAKWQQELEGLPDESVALYEWNLTKDISEGQRGALTIDYAPPLHTFNARTEAFARDHVFEEDRQAFRAFMNREHLIAQYFSRVYNKSLDYRFVTDEGAVRWRQITVQLVPYPDTQDIKAYVTNRDINAEKSAALALLARSEQDYLTGALNRGTFTARVDEMIAKAPGSGLALLMLDVDGFKRINDSLGHDTGDKVLSDMVNRTRAVLRAGDMVGRIGGDEFMICLPDMPFDAAIGKKAEQLCAALRRRINGQITVSVSIGIAVYPRDGADFKALYPCADAALYHAKHGGKDGYAFYQKDMSGGGRLTEIDEAHGDVVTIPRRPAVLVATDSDAAYGELSAILAPDYDAIRTDAAVSMPRLRADGSVIYAAILDMETAAGRDMLRLAGKRLQEEGLDLYAVVAERSSEDYIQLIKSGVTFAFARPIDTELLLLRLKNLYAVRNVEESRLQSDFQRLQATEETRYREVLGATGTTVFIYDVATGTYQADLLPDQFTAGSFEGHSLGEEMVKKGIMEPADVGIVQEAMALVESGKSRRESRTVRLTSKGGARHYFRFQIMKMENADVLTPKLLLTVNDVNDQVEAEERLRFRAERDALTGLYNRETFFEKATQMIHAHEPGYYVMACFDIDNFKVINDQYGVAKGDEVLRFIADTFDEGFSKAGGICCRVMADNFAVLYPRSFMESAEIARVRDRAAAVDSAIQPISFSIGRYIVNDLSLPASAMFDRASLAETSVKGRFDVNIAQYDESMRMHLLKAQEIINEMNAALSAGQFEIWFQPQYNHATGALVGAEALVRWRHPKRGLIPPADFIPLFERNGFIYEMDKYVWEQACLYLRRWLDAGRSPLPISVNVSRYDVFREDFYSTITGLVEKYGLPVGLLRLEITESAFAQSSAQIIGMVKRLISYGFTIEIDDFGSGYSSLNTLKDVPAGVLKLDMRFLENSENSRRGGNILESIVRMAKWLGMPVIAEGVETLEQADYLKSIGCYYVQGYLYARPMPAADYEKLGMGSDKEEQMTAMETIAPMDNNAFWDPKSMETLIFNSYVGGACILEYHNGKVEILRANDKYAREMGEQGLSVEDALGLGWAEHMDIESRTAGMNAIQQAISAGEETAFEAVLHDLPGERGRAYFHVSMRALASAGDRYLFYCTVDNITHQREAEAKIRETDEQLRFLNDTAHDLLVQTGDNLGIENVLTKILHYFGGSRAYIYEYNYDDKTCSNTYEVCAPGVTPYRHAYRRVPLDTAGFWLNSFKKSNFLYIPDAENLGGSRLAEYSVLHTLGVRSSLAVSLRSNGSLIGTMGVFDPTLHLTDVDNLSALGDYMAVILARRDLSARIESDNAMLLNLMNDTPGGFSRIQCHPSGLFTMAYANEGFCKLVDMTRQQVMELYGENAMAGVHPEDAKDVLSAVEQVLSTGGRLNAKYRMRHGKGGYIRLTVFGRLTHNESGETFLNMYYTDMTEVDRMEEQRKELLDNLPCGAGIYELCDGQLSVSFLNKRYMEFVGRKLEDLRDAPVVEVVHPEDRQHMLSALRDAVQGNGTGACDVRILHGSGAYVPLHVEGKVLNREEGKTVIYATYTPISKEELSFRDMLPVALAAMMNSSSDLSFVKDRNLTYICCSRAFAAMVGLRDEKEIAGKTDHDLFNTAMAEKYRADDRKLMQGGESLIDYLEEIPSEDGTLHYSSTSKYLLHDSAGTVIGLYGAGRDVTAQMETQRLVNVMELALNTAGLEHICIIHARAGTYESFYGGGFHNVPDAGSYDQEVATIRDTLVVHLERERYYARNCLSTVLERLGEGGGYSNRYRLRDGLREASFQCMAAGRDEIVMTIRRLDSEPHA